MLFFLGKMAANQYAWQNAMAVVKHYGLRRRSIFSTEGSFGKGQENPDPPIPSFFCKKNEEPPKKARIFLSAEAWKRRAKLTKKQGKKRVREYYQEGLDPLISEF